MVYNRKVFQYSLKGPLVDAIRNCRLIKTSTCLPALVPVDSVLPPGTPDLLPELHRGPALHLWSRSDPLSFTQGHPSAVLPILSHILGLPSLLSNFPSVYKCPIILIPLTTDSTKLLLTPSSPFIGSFMAKPLERIVYTSVSNSCPPKLSQTYCKHVFTLTFPWRMVL